VHVVGLFAGIGGIELGLHQSGHDTLLFCEKDPSASAVLRARFPGIPIHDDVTTLQALPEGTDLVTAGFPCQDLSQAGRASGIGGQRSGLVQHVFRLLRDRPIPWVLIENVPFMLQLGQGAAMEHVVTELESLGYRWAYRVMDSRAFGLPQRRRRVYLLASLDGDPENILFSRDADPPPALSHENRPVGFSWTEGTRGLGWAVGAVPTLKGGSGLGIPSPPAIWFPDGRIVTPDIRDAERLQGFPEDWTAPASEVGRASLRWKLVGNAVSVPAAAAVGEWLLENSGAVEGRSLDRRGSWPTAAFGSTQGRFALTASEWPISTVVPDLDQFLIHSGRELSERATRGFTSRLNASSLNYPDAFMRALKAHLCAVSRGAP
jgi:DNA (cytosine-5)-methyltransferase 1